jgi:hypothetical protein
VAVVLDSDAVVGFLDRNDALHAAADTAIREVARESRLLVSVITYAELQTGARLGHHPQEKVQGFFTQLISAVLPVDLKVADRAAELRSSRKSLRMPDALVLATAETAEDADMIVTGDEKLSKVPGVACGVRLLR